MWKKIQENDNKKDTCIQNQQEAAETSATNNGKSRLGEFNTYGETKDTVGNSD